MFFDIPAFLESLKYMLSGMVGIFVVMLVIYALIILLGKAFSSKKKKD